MHALSADGSLVPVFARRGPFVTVYLDATHGPDDGADVIDERWAAVRETLDGADPDSLDAIEESLTAEFVDTGAHGLVAVAADGELCLSARMATPPATEGFHTPLPQLMPYLTSRPPHLDNVVIAADTIGTRILTWEAGDLRTLSAALPAGEDGADVVARVVARLASQVNPDVIVVTGDRESRERVSPGLARVLVSDVVVRSVDARTEDAAELRGVVDGVLRDYCRHAESEVIASIRALANDRDRVATGFRDVAAALRMAQVDAVIAADDEAMLRRCWVGPRPTEFGMHDAEAHAVGLTSVRHDRAGSALVRAMFATGARFATVGPDGWQPPHGIAALLR